jgi:hypothetical protein
MEPHWRTRIHRSIATPPLYELVIGSDVGVPRTSHFHHSQLNIAPEILPDKLQTAVYLTGGTTSEIVASKLPRDDPKAWHDLFYLFIHSFELPCERTFNFLMRDWLLGAEYGFKIFQNAMMMLLKEKAGLDVYADMDEDVVKEAFVDEKGYR